MVRGRPLSPPGSSGAGGPRQSSCGPRQRLHVGLSSVSRRRGYRSTTPAQIHGGPSQGIDVRWPSRRNG